LGLQQVKNDEAFVAFERVQKSYDGETLVVKDLNLTIPKGEFLTLLGPSGSGKTTCLMMLAGFETATHGDIRLDGVSVNNIPRNRSKTAGNMARYAFVALCLLFAQTWQRWRTIWARCGTGWAPLMFNLSPR
jgi:ABC-type transporter Mla maintaining outer membrane lipid asymmetry ATPase subunit MlaF